VSVTTLAPASVSINGSFVLVVVTVIVSSEIVPSLSPSASAGEDAAATAEQRRNALKDRRLCIARPLMCLVFIGWLADRAASL